MRRRLRRRKNRPGAKAAGAGKVAHPDMVPTQCVPCAVSSHVPLPEMMLSESPDGGGVSVSPPAGGGGGLLSDVVVPLAIFERAPNWAF